MTLPRALSTAVEGATGAQIAAATPVGGGCINHGTRVETTGGTSYFLKWNGSAPPGMFAAEADGLRALRASGSLRVPNTIGWGEDAEGTAWLLLEYIPSGTSTREYNRRLGVGLARLHQGEAHHGESAHLASGWECDNWIGSLPQENGVMDGWADFWRVRRIEPQIARARQKGFLPDAELDELVQTIPHALADVDQIGTLHGDLWGGNVFADEVGQPVLIDPAVYRGHGEVDLAMSELFGGFGSGFYEAYDSEVGIAPEYAAFRRDLYQLYYLLVHVNLFGASYVDASRRAALNVLRAFR